MIIVLEDKKLKDIKIIQDKMKDIVIIKTTLNSILEFLKIDLQITEMMRKIKILKNMDIKGLTNLCNIKINSQIAALLNNNISIEIDLSSLVVKNLMNLVVIKKDFKVLKHDIMIIVRDIKIIVVKEIVLGNLIKIQKE